MPPHIYTQTRLTLTNQSSSLWLQCCSICLSLIIQSSLFWIKKKIETQEPSTLARIFHLYIWFNLSWVLQEIRDLLSLLKKGMTVPVLMIQVAIISSSLFLFFFTTRDNCSLYFLWWWWSKLNTLVKEEKAPIKIALIFIHSLLSSSLPIFYGQKNIEQSIITSLTYKSW